MSGSRRRSSGCSHAWFEEGTQHSVVQPASIELLVSLFSVSICQDPPELPAGNGAAQPSPVPSVYTRAWQNLTSSSGIVERRSMRQLRALQCTSANRASASGSSFLETPMGPHEHALLVRSGQPQQDPGTTALMEKLGLIEHPCQL